MDLVFRETKKDPERDCFVYTAHSFLDRIGIEGLRRGVDQDLLGRPLVGPAGSDPFEEHTTHILVMVEGELVAGTEMVAHSSLGLPIPGWSRIRGQMYGSRRTVQARRILLHPGHPNTPLPELPYGALGGLLKGCLQWAVSNDVGDVVMEVSDPRAAERLGQLGAAPLGSSGPDRATVLRINVNALTARGFRSKNPFYRYLLTYDESVLVSGPASSPALKTDLPALRYTSA
jgi:hypothetical protein